MRKFEVVENFTRSRDEKHRVVFVGQHIYVWPQPERGDYGKEDQAEARSPVKHVAAFSV